MEQLINFIIRPPRAEYDQTDDLLDQEFMLKGKWYLRKDIEVKNSRGDTLQCSHYMPIICPEDKSLPCVIYCHGNSGCRTDASEAAIILLPSNITVFTLDFSGSGLSGGEHVTLGWNEKDDLAAVVEYLREDGNVSLIGLWGRSMGAVTSLMYGAEDPSIAGMVLDSPFSDLVELMMELVDTYKVRIPKFTVKFAIQYMRRAILKKAKFDITELNTIKVAKSCFVPVLLGHAEDDGFIQPHHTDRIYEAYVGDKNVIKFLGDHNSPRPQFYFDSINIFFHNVLQPPEDDVGETFLDTMPDYFGRDKWSTLPERGHAEDNFFAAGLASSTTEDAIEQLRSKRQMSRMEVPSDVSSQDKSAENEEGSRNKLRPSSSNMTSFELSDGHPYGPHVPASIDADDYLEYSLDNSLSDFPSNLEEEERMFREAMMESLKDMGTLSNNTTEYSLDDNSEKPNSLPNGYESSVLLPSSEQSAIIGHNSADQIQSDDKLLISSAQSEPQTLAETSNSPANTVSSANDIETVGFTKAMSSTQSEPQTLAEANTV
ncbi:uncharacterized protein LOC124933665 [Impatiens glandulifera]|uniref:uncharacterized protein LOC124933665 n=1 Tax=Impatiens glandulifera TaxID=253017 RepID=UPI001FB143FA|nr:uncharacterized protein LOC124933665 [Impatiens glandulifera]